MTEYDKEGIDFIFFPKTIAIVGATADPRKFGHEVVKNIITGFGVKGISIYPVNPSKTPILGLPTYGSLKDIPEEVDQVIILVPSKYVEMVVDEAIVKGTKSIIIITAGFAEIDDKGAEIEARIAQKCKNAGIRVVGPNCVGMMNASVGLNASFVKTPIKGKLSLVSQSGSFGANIIYQMLQERLGVEKFATLGNMCDLGFEELLPYLANDDETEVIGLYIETVNDGHTFREALEKTSKKKPVLVFKAGKTDFGSESAKSHTGSIAGSPEIFEDLVRHGGGILVDSMLEFLETAKTMLSQPMPKGKKIGIITNAGGPGVIVSDHLFLQDLEMAKFDESLTAELDKELIPLIKKVNPLDLIAGARQQQYYFATKHLLSSDSIDAVISICVIPTFLEMGLDEHYVGMIEAWEETSRQKPLFPILLSGNVAKTAVETGQQLNAPIFLQLPYAVKALKNLIDRSEWLQRHQ